jgi:hypothetical protein
MYKLTVIWPQKTQISFLKTHNHSLAETEKAHTEPFSTYTLRFGVKHGLSLSALSHEAVHAATWILNDVNYRTWSPEWRGVDFQTEETYCYIVEVIVQQVIARAQQMEIPLVNPLRENIKCLL